MHFKSFRAMLMAGIIAITFMACSKKNNGGGGTPPPPPPTPTTTTLNISGMAFPASTTVKKGTIVKWVNQDGMAHTVTSDDGVSFNSGNMNNGATFSYTTNKAGTFNYHCNYHSAMTAVLIVTE